MRVKTHPTSLAVMAVILLTLTLMLASGTSIILIAIDFISKASHFSSPTRSAYSINIMMLFFLSVLPGHIIGKIIQAKNAIILASILSSIGLIMLSLANLIDLGTSIFTFGLSMAYINYLNLTLHLMRTRQKYLDMGVFIFFYFAVIGLLLGVGLQEVTSHWLGNANTYLISGILTVLSLLLFIFLNHFFIPQEVTPEQSQQTLFSHIYRTTMICILSVIVILFLYKTPTLTKVFTFILLLGIFINRFHKMRQSHYAMQHTVYFYTLSIALLFWVLSGIGNFLFNNIRAEKFWLYTFTQWYSLNTNVIARNSAVMSFFIALLIPVFYYFNGRLKRPTSYFSGIAVGCLILACGQISLWIPVLLGGHHSGSLSYLLPFHWIIFYELGYSLASMLILCNLYTLSNRLFIHQNQKFVLVELTVLAALVWLIISFISNLISWEISTVGINSWRAVYPGISGTLGLLMLGLAMGIFWLNQHLKKRYGNLIEFQNVFWQKVPIAEKAVQSID